jgi:hypothetical protein
VQLDSSSLDTFKEVLGGELAPQEKGQRLLDLYLADRQQQARESTENQYKVWNDTQTQWQEKVRLDPELGGNRFNTTVQTCKGAVNRYAGTPEQIAQAKADLTMTGAGNCPSIIRLIHNMARALQESSPVTQTAAPKPPQSRAQKRYNTSGAN